MATQDIQRLARYPFLDAAAAFMAGQSISLGEIMGDRIFKQARADGMQRLMDTLQYRRIEEPAASGYADHLNVIVSYVVARIIVAAVRDPMLISWYSVAEATRAIELLGSEDQRFVAEVANELGLPLERLEQEGEVKPGGRTGTGKQDRPPGPWEIADFSLHFTDYLRFAPRLKSAPWKLVNQPMRAGRIPLEKEKAVRLLREVIAMKFEQDLSAMKVDRAITRTFRDQIIVLKNRMAEIRTVMEQQSFTELDIGRIPPCIATLLAMTRSGQNVSHVGRFSMTAFLLHIGMKTDAVIEQFRVSPDFREDLARYQVEHISGEISGTEYSPLSCDSMKTHGICYRSDALCERIKHPLSYYEQRMEGLRPDEDRRIREACSTAESLARYQKLTPDKAAALRRKLMGHMANAVFSIEGTPETMSTIPPIPPAGTPAMSQAISSGQVVALRLRIRRAGHSAVVFKHPSQPEDIYTVFTYATLEDSRKMTMNAMNILDWTLGNIIRERQGDTVTLAGQFVPLDERRMLFHVIGIVGEKPPTEPVKGRSVEGEAAQNESIQEESVQEVSVQKESVQKGSESKSIGEATKGKSDIASEGIA